MWSLCTWLEEIFFLKSGIKQLCFFLGFNSISRTNSFNTAWPKRCGELSAFGTYTSPSPVSLSLVDFGRTGVSRICWWYCFFCRFTVWVCDLWFAFLCEPNYSFSENGIAVLLSLTLSCKGHKRFLRYISVHKRDIKKFGTRNVLLWTEWVLNHILSHQCLELYGEVTI